MASKAVSNNTLRFARRAVYCLPGPGKEARGGEDAFYCTSSSLGIADGVGSWESEGVDPSLYPRKLMASALRASALPRKQLDRASDFPPLAILDLAYREAAQSRLMGSCTAVVSSMIDDNRLGVLNVGDSGLRIVRDGKLFFGTTELQWRFNCPHQLGPTSRDTPAGGERSILTLHDGDVVVLGTDGLFDNVYDEDIVKIVAPLGEDYRKQKESGSKPSTEITASTIAEKLARYAKSLSYNRSGASPFARNAATAGHFYQGGKPDDITVVVALAQSVNLAAAAEDKATSLGGSSDASDSNDGSVTAEQMVEAAASMNEEKCPLLVEEFFLAKGLTMKSTSGGGRGGNGSGGWRSRL